MQYTLRRVPPALDQALRARAQREGKSLNQVAIDALAQAMGFGAESIRYRTLDDLCGTWRDDPAFDEAIADQQRIDESLWR